MSFETPPLFDLIAAAIGLVSLIWTIVKRVDIAKTKMFGVWCAIWAVPLLIAVIGYITAHDWKCLPWIGVSAAAIIVLSVTKKNL